MKTITLDEAYHILENSAAVIIDEWTVVFPSLAQLTDDDDNEFLYLSWTDDGPEYNLKFTQGDNPSVRVEGSSMFLYDTDSAGEHDHTQITVLVPQKLD
jgi:hypothetical protein